MNFLNLDLFRAAVRTQPRWKIHFYVMAHSPGTTPNAWRRQFYGDLGHGMQIVNLFQLAPVQAAATENYVNAPPMYASIQRALAELTRWEDIVQSGRVQCASSALWFSEAGDIWDDNRDPFAAAKRSLYVAIRHQELPLDVIVEEDALAGELSKYAVLYLADGHVTRAASEKIAAWVAAGGQLFATAGAGMLNELNEPNEILKHVLGVEQMALDVPIEATVRFEKEDLPFAKPLDAATWKDERGVHSIAAYAAKSCFKTVRSEVLGTFTDGSPAISRNRVGCGTAIYCGLLPGLAYFAPAMPKRPVDRGARDDSMAHFIPTLFDLGASTLIGSVAASLHRPVKCSQPLVETSIIRANCGTAIPLVNWTAGPIAGLRVTIDLPVANESVSLASGAPVAVTRNGGTLCCTFDLETADALILR